MSSSHPAVVPPETETSIAVIAGSAPLSGDPGDPGDRRGAHRGRRTARRVVLRSVIPALVVVTALAVMAFNGGRRWSPEVSGYLSAEVDGVALDPDDPVAAGQGAVLDREKYGLDVVATAGYHDQAGAPTAAVLAVNAKALNLAGVLEVIEGTQGQLGAKRSVDEMAGLQVVNYRVDDPAQVTYVARPRPDVLVIVTSLGGSPVDTEHVLSAVLDAGSS